MSQPILFDRIKKQIISASQQTQLVQDTLSVITDKKKRLEVAQKVQSFFRYALTRSISQ